jgi:hypothetical protein
VPDWLVSSDAIKDGWANHVGLARFRIEYLRRVSLLDLQEKRNPMESVSGHGGNALVIGGGILGCRKE